MKKEFKNELFTKTGRLKKRYSGMINHFRDNRIHPCTWTGSNKFRSLKDDSDKILTLLNAFGYKHTTGNDAPRGGVEGFYIKISSRAKNRIFNFIKSNA